MRVTPGLPDSYEQLLHEVAVRSQRSPLADFQLLLRSNASLPSVRQLSGSALRTLAQPARLERAIGVQYVKRTERWSHYFRAHLHRQFDALLHFETTSALTPIEPSKQTGREDKTDAGDQPPDTDEEGHEEEEEEEEERMG